MKRFYLFLLYVSFLSYCPSEVTSKTVAKITSYPIRRSRMSHGSGRLSLINYRFNRRPKKKHLDTAELKMILGTSFDPKFMSIERPPNFDREHAGATYVVREDNWRYIEMVKELKDANLTRELQQIAGDRFIVEPEYVKAVEKWLLKKASCPVKYAWEDIGALFWPRYVRRGECSTEPGRCSWPSGMNCIPSGSTNIHILRWQCRTPKGKGRKKGYKTSVNKNFKEEEKPLNLKCSWVRVPYPITTDCMCTC